MFPSGEFWHPKRQWSTVARDWHPNLSATEWIIDWDCCTMEARTYASLVKKVLKILWGYLRCLSLWINLIEHVQITQPSYPNEEEHRCACPFKIISRKESVVLPILMWCEVKRLCVGCRCDAILAYVLREPQMCGYFGESNDIMLLSVFCGVSVMLFWWECFMWVANDVIWWCIVYWCRGIWTLSILSLCWCYWVQYIVSMRRGFHLLCRIYGVSLLCLCGTVCVCV